MTNNSFSNVLDLVEAIDAAHLSDAYVSIESERAEELVKFLKENNIESSVSYWNAPESLYVGDQKDKKNLVVLAIHW